MGSTARRPGLSVFAVEPAAKETIPASPDDPAAAIPPATPLLLTAVDAATLCRVSERTWRNWDASGHIPGPVRIGRSLFWRPKELADWVDAGCPDRHTWNVRRN
jgi:predicted DNA-binding transcriptional regulator AlpA